MYEGTLTIQDRKEVADRTVVFHMEIENAETKNPALPQKITTLPFMAGQFISIGFSKKEWRAYSIASPPDQENIELVIRLVPNGFGSSILETAKPGDQFPFRGPFGQFVLSKTPQKTLVFCATGTGIAPFRSMIMTEAKRQNPRPMILFYGGRHPRDIAYRDEILSWAQNISVKFGYSKAKKETLAENEYQGWITQFVEPLDIQAESYEFYLCGNKDMIASITEILEKKNMSKENIYMERFN